MAKQPKIVYQAMFDVHGNIVKDPKKAAYRETLTDDGMRAYAENPSLIPDGYPKAKPVVGRGLANPMSRNGFDPETLDFVKTRSWDVRSRSTNKLVTTLDEWFEVLGFDPAMTAEERFMAVSHQLSLPYWSAAPDELKDEVYAWIVETRDRYLSPKRSAD